MNPSRGFTLLELLVVLALLGLATGLVAAPSYRMIASWRRATVAEQVLGELVALTASAREHGQMLTLQAGAVPHRTLTQLPQDWSLQLDQSLRIQANGACSGSTGRLHWPEGSMPFALDAPYCRLRLAPDAP